MLLIVYLRGNSRLINMDNTSITLISQGELNGVHQQMIDEIKIICNLKIKNSILKREIILRGNSLKNQMDYV